MEKRGPRTFEELLPLLGQGFLGNGRELSSKKEARG